MRKRIVSQLALFDQSVRQLASLMIRPPLVLRKMDQDLSENPEFVDLVHTDLTGNASEVGAHGMSAEQVLRTAILRQMKQYSWRELADRLHDGICLRWFTRFYSADVPHFTTLQKAITAINDTTWEQINDLMVDFAKEQKIEKGRALRTDTTVIEKERWFKNLQKFRAGIEGIISTLMRGYGLKRCIWKGWQAFKRYVALSVVTFNLKKIAVLL